MTGEIFFIDYNTSWARNNFESLKKIYPFVHRIPYDDNLATIFEYAKNKSKTYQFWVIDSSTRLLPSCNLDFVIDNYDKHYIHSYLTFSNKKIRNEGVYLLTKDFKLEYKYQRKLVGYDYSFFDVVFISYNEPKAEENYEKLKRHLRREVLRITGVKGIHNAHLEAAKICKTPMFWVVDADARVLSNFKFNYKPLRWDFDTVHIWRSRNPVNGLEYGYGGVKLLPTNLVLNMNLNSVDMATSISNKLKVMPYVSNYTDFNTDPYSSWRSAFRECVKLASSVIDDNDSNLERLDIWCNNANGMYSKESLSGAISGRKYGEENKGNLNALAMINDFDWLQSRWQAERS